MPEPAATKRSGRRQRCERVVSGSEPTAAGIGTGGGSGRFLADWVAGGAPPYDLSNVDPARYAEGPDRAACLDRIRQTYAAGYTLPGPTAGDGLG